MCACLAMCPVHDQGAVYVTDCRHLAAAGYVVPLDPGRIAVAVIPFMMIADDVEYNTAVYAGTLEILIPFLGMLLDLVVFYVGKSVVFLQYFPCDKGHAVIVNQCPDTHIGHLVRRQVKELVMHQQR